MVYWIRPYEGELKFNVDGATRGKLGPVGIVGVLRNSKGFVIAISSITQGMLFVALF